MTKMLKKTPKPKKPKKDPQKARSQIPYSGIGGVWVGQHVKGPRITITVPLPEEDGRWVRATAIVNRHKRGPRDPDYIVPGQHVRWFICSRKSANPLSEKKNSGDGEKEAESRAGRGFEGGKG